MNICETLKYWQEVLDIKDWNISLKRTTFVNKHFRGLSRNFETKEAIILHDIDLTEESILQELLYIVHPEQSETSINEMTQQYIHSKYKY